MISDNRFRFSGKEEQALFDLPYQDFGFRMYDPGIGRWTGPDLLAEKYYSHSPYNYCVNNPIKFIDPNGLYTFETITVTAPRLSGGGRVYIYYEIRGNKGYDGPYKDPLNNQPTNNLSNYGGGSSGLSGNSSSNYGGHVRSKGLNTFAQKLYAENPMAAVIHNAHKSFWLGTAEIAAFEIGLAGDVTSTVGALMATTGVGSQFGLAFMGIGATLSGISTGINIGIDLSSGNYVGAVMRAGTWGLERGIGKLGSMSSPAVNGGVSLFFTPTQMILNYSAGTTRK